MHGLRETRWLKPFTWDAFFSRLRKKKINSTRYIKKKSEASGSLSNTENYEFSLVNINENKVAKINHNYC